MNNIYEKEFFTKIVLESKSISEVVRKLGIKTGRGNRQTVKNYILKYNIPTDHFGYYFDGNMVRRKPSNIEDILSNKIPCFQHSLKKMLYKLKLKQRICEMCGQGEEWKGKNMSLILDHINGVNNDNRLENLRILCPNCNATLDTHCSKNKTKFSIKAKENFCLDCGTKILRTSKRCFECDHIKQRKVERPPYGVLVDEIEKLGYSAVGRKYGVSDNAIRKWIKAYIKSSVGSNPTLS